MLYKLGLNALIGTTCIVHCQVDVVVVALSLMLSCRCCQVVEIINELLLRNYVKH